MKAKASHSVSGINFSVNVKKVKGAEYYVVNFRDHNGRQIQRSTGFKADEKNYSKALKKAKEIVSEFVKQYEQAGGKSDIDTAAAQPAAMVKPQFVQSVFTQPAMVQTPFMQFAYPGNSILLNDYISEWLHRSKNGLKSTTYDNYQSMFKCHIKQYFEGFMLADIKAMHLQEYINEKLQVGISPNTVRKHISLLGTIMTDAVNNDLIQYNPVDRVKKPQKIEPEKNRYTPDELRRLLQVTKGTEIEAPIFIASVLGLRRSEILGLRWQDIDFINKTLTVNGSVTRNNIDGKWKDIYGKTLKTKASHGMYYLNDYVYEYFNSLFERNYNLISNVDDCKDFVCVNAVGERLKVDFVTQKFSKILKENGLRHIRFHDLRHSVLDYLSKHFDPKSVQGYARHANFQVTYDIYCQSDVNDTRSQLDCVCSALGFGGASSQGLQENLQEKAQEICRKYNFSGKVLDG